MTYNLIIDWCLHLLEGDHGYSNDDLEMHPFFIAHGPAFKKGFQSESFNNVDLYPLLCHILDIEPVPNNGSLENIENILFVHDSSFVTIVTCEFLIFYSVLHDITSTVIYI